jgi:hypothetical protein
MVKEIKVGPDLDSNRKDVYAVSCFSDLVRAVLGAKLSNRDGIDKRKFQSLVHIHVVCLGPNM